MLKSLDRADTGPGSEGARRELQADDEAVSAVARQHLMAGGYGSRSCDDTLSTPKNTASGRIGDGPADQGGKLPKARPVLAAHRPPPTARKKLHCCVRAL